MKRAVRRALLLSALAVPSSLYALGLGEIRLNSALNQPFDAEIELVAATAEDLGALRAALAPGETFERYGIDKPAYLSDFTFRVGRSGGRDVLKVSSPRPVTEPFVTLLVEASWPRGRLLREYTVLLDPPSMAQPVVAAPPPVPAPRPELPQGDPVAIQPAPAPSPEPVARPVREAPPPRASIEPGSTYRVRANDTLWRIASEANPGTRAEVNRMMVAIYQANPSAFAGNINVLRAGSELRIPSQSEVSGITASAAADEVARQYRLWTQGPADAAAPADAGGRLRLVTPEEAPPAAEAAAAAPGGQAENAQAASGRDADLQARVQRLETELAETRRLLEVRSAELATLQGAAAPADAGPANAAPVDAGPADAAPGGSDVAAPATEVPSTPVPDAVPEEAVAVPAPAPAPQAAPRPERPRKAAPPQVVDEPTLLERLRGYWWVVLPVLLAALGFAAWRRRRTAAAPGGESLEEALGRPTDDLRSRPLARRREESDILVEERQPVEALSTAGSAAPAVVVAGARATDQSRRTITVEDTLSGDGAASIEAGDPLAEADFHMAYGLYDQAADLVQLAIKREPNRRDLQLKLVEIYFVWGNKARFLELAREMHGSRSRAEPGEWDKVHIMGRQIAPEDALFSGAPAASAASGLDLELHGGPATTDFELSSGEAPAPDLDLTMRSPEVRSDDALDFLLDEPVRGGDEASQAPTVETPRIRGSADDVTAEVPIEELGLDTSALEDFVDVGAATGAHNLPYEDTVEQQRPRADGDTVQAPVLPHVGGDTIESTVIERVLGDTVEATVLQRNGGDTVQAPRVARDGGDTVEQPRFARAGDDTVREPALPREGDTVEQDLLSATSILRADLEALAQRAAASGIEVVEATGELPAAALDDLDVTGELERLDLDKAVEEITMSEVGTKLDLARAYVDMGDPEGARSILEEVLKEGSANHKQEAERLLAGLP